MERHSTSPLMRDLFGDDLELVRGPYHARIEALERRHPHLSREWARCHGRAGFLLPQMLAEYGFHAAAGRTMPAALREPALSLGLVALAVCVDDDAVDERGGDLVGQVEAVSTSELLSAHAFSRLVERGPDPVVRAVLREMSHLLDTVTRYQQLDARNITRSLRHGFDLDPYLRATYKTGSLATAGLRLGLALAGSPVPPEIEQLGRRLGRIVQLLDDVLDLDDDLASHGAPVTLPMQLAARGEPLAPVFDLVDDALRESRKLAAAIGGGDRLSRCLAGLDVVAGRLRTRR